MNKTLILILLLMIVNCKNKYYNMDYERSICSNCYSRSIKCQSLKDGEIIPCEDIFYRSSRMGDNYKCTEEGTSYNFNYAFSRYYHTHEIDTGWLKTYGFQILILISLGIKVLLR